MTVQKEASRLWWFDSHNISHCSPWLQSTLSKLEDRTKEMLQLIEGDADTFAQRAEMYYKKRPELISKIEDFYRSYRSLAVRHDQLKLESGNFFPNRDWFHKDWSTTDKSCESSTIMSDFEGSEGEDPEPEEYQLEIKVREAPTTRNGNDLGSLMNENGVERTKASIKDDISYVYVDSDDSGLSEIIHPDFEEAEVESKLQEVPQKKSDESEVIIRSTKDELFEHSEVVHGELKEAQVEIDSKEFPEEDRESKAQRIRMIEENKGGSHLVRLIMRELEKLKEENENLKAELAKKDEEKREVIRQLSMSVGILKEENHGMKMFIKDSKRWIVLSSKFKKLKEFFSGKKLERYCRSQTTVVAL